MSFRPKSTYFFPSMRGTAQINHFFAVSMAIGILAVCFLFSLSPGESLKLENPVFRAEVGSKEVVEAVFKIQNVSDREISIISVSRDCDCAAVENLPIPISPGSTVAVNVSISIRGGQKVPGNRVFVFNTDAPGERLVGRVELSLTQ